ncbi:MAG: DNA-binding protein [Bacteroidales bacterium]|nr:DNA-binding protein [Bacteroidales bacterium]MCF8390736.1 DNA-binding protein [Bacteroidales bacterium]
MKNLTNSTVARQNILNNAYAIDEINQAIGIRFIKFEDQHWLTKAQLARFFEIDERTVDRYIESDGEELRRNGYVILKGKRLKDLKLAIKEMDVDDMNVVDKSPQLGLFNFRAFLNIGMLLTESEKAKTLRSIILDIALDTINKRTGGSTKYINQRDEDFILSYYKEESYRKEFTDALHNYVAMGNAKYAIYTNKIYQAIFKEHAAEYRQILKLTERDNVRETLYSEVLDLISSYEFGLAKLIEERYFKKGSPLKSVELDSLFLAFENLPLWVPLVEKARRKMASRDLAFRDVLHQQLEGYIGAVPAEDFERFLGEKSKELAERINEAKDVFKRLKERE